MSELTAPDPGNLPARMAEVMRAHGLLTGGALPDGHGTCTCGHWTGTDWTAHLAEVACGVRDELVAHLSARAAVAEARVGHAEAGAELSSERLAEVRQDLAEARATIERMRALDDVYPCGSVYVVPYGSGGWREVLPAADLRAALSASAPSEVADV